MLFWKLFYHRPIHADLNDRGLISDEEMEAGNGNFPFCDANTRMVVGQIQVKVGMQSDGDLGKGGGAKGEGEPPLLPWLSKG